MMSRAKPTFAALPMLALLAALPACGKAAPELPADRGEAAATCYAAEVVKAPGKTLTADQANKAAQFLFLGAVSDGLASPTVLAQLATKAHGLQDKVAEGGNAAGYESRCADRFPPTAAGSFKDLPADSRDTRMMCFTLSSALLQTYQSSGINPTTATLLMNTKLDEGLRTEINAEGNVNPAELAGFAMRAMAKATELGPTDEVLAACSKRYGGT